MSLAFDAASIARRVAWPGLGPCCCCCCRCGGGAGNASQLDCWAGGGGGHSESGGGGGVEGTQTAVKQFRREQEWRHGKGGKTL